MSLLKWLGPPNFQTQHWNPQAPCRQPSIGIHDASAVGSSNLSDVNRGTQLHKPRREVRELAELLYAVEMWMMLLTMLKMMMLIVLIVLMMVMLMLTMKN